MFDISSIPSYSQFVYWFIKKDNCWEVVDRVTNAHVDTVSESEAREKYKVDFLSFSLRPEFKVGNLVRATKDVSTDAVVDAYEELLLGCQLLRIRREFMEVKKNDPESIASFELDSYIPKFNKMIQWIQSTDFYTAPASTRYHESYVSGLLRHSINVYNNIMELHAVPKFSRVELDSAALCALSHDWCKIGFYEPYEKNVKDDTTGQWRKETAFKQNQTSIPLGHGVSSMFVLSRFIRLNTDEALAIRWHMGSWRVVDAEMNELQSANEKCPLVHMLQFADQLSIVSY